MDVGKPSGCASYVLVPGLNGFLACIGAGADLKVIQNLADLGPGFTLDNGVSDDASSNIVGRSQTADEKSLLASVWAHGGLNSDDRLNHHFLELPFCDDFWFVSNGRGDLRSRFASSASAASIRRFNSGCCSGLTES